MSNKITRISREGTAETDNLPNIISGSDVAKLWLGYTDTTEQLSVGHWESDACKFSVKWEEHGLSQGRY
ncbi:hypothetical protein SAMN05444358_102254 [Ruegeria halocynthiae]|uniref:Uncharacterized protein n=1 Tax=Ruegeria halocynthiae TaxID=985054 RepID=A0A1H2YET0_9RHOB|nr:hypothetical protein [Ruegeria halocynthiae]SDX03521.1 hypothetical protein SAMN05444358_102254 [Ruegeria halocynthiae]